MLPRSRAGFSLVELLTVIAIMAVLSGLLVASLSQSDSARLTAAGNTMENTLTLARQNSIGKNAYTAVVVRTSGAGAYSAYVLMQFQYDTNPPAGGPLGSWTQLTAWKTLPTGIYFDPASTVFPAPPSGDNFLGTSDSFATALPDPLLYQGQPVPLANTIYHIFQPDGSLVTNQELRLRLMEGTFSSGTVPTCKQVDGAGNPLDYYDVFILVDTGQVHISRQTGT